MQNIPFIEIPLPEIFNQKLLFQYLRRSPNEITFTVLGESEVYKLFDLQDDLILSKLTFYSNQIIIEILKGKPNSIQLQSIESYVRNWFDLDTDLKNFNKLAEKDKILEKILPKLHGLRLVKSPDLFEAISWSIIGQQINLPFAYSCKKALVEKAGSQMIFENKIHYTFPRPKEILKINDLEFRSMKFSRQKVNYIRGVAEAIIAGDLVLNNLNFEDARVKLIALKGIGNWSANYVLMRCLDFKEAFPIEDVGLQNALKNQLGINTKPSLEEIKMMAKNWSGWEAYATFYLWQTLLPE